MNKIHAIKDRDSADQEGITYCGMKGWRGDRLSSEYSTAMGNIFEASVREREVTCARCRRALDGEKR